MGAALDSRKTTILFAVIDAYVRSAEPVASQAIVASRVVDASPATVRNDMVVLEENGYLAQPHTSSGRVPTEAAYRLYVAYLQQQRAAIIADVVASARCALAEELEARIVGKMLARILAASAEQAIVVGFSRGDAYATGLSYLVVQPEFQDPRVLREFSVVMDDLDTAMRTLDALLNGTPRVLLGNENPFGQHCGTVGAHLALPAGETLTFGIVGPMRMAYDRQLGLLTTVCAATEHETV